MATIVPLKRAAVRLWFGYNLLKALGFVGPEVRACFGSGDNCTEAFGPLSRNATALGSWQSHKERISKCAGVAPPREDREFVECPGPFAARPVETDDP